MSNPQAAARAMFRGGTALFGTRLRSSNIARPGRGQLRDLW
jgi:hypothetical protein